MIVFDACDLEEAKETLIGIQRKDNSYCYLHWEHRPTAFTSKYKPSEFKTKLTKVSGLITQIAPTSLVEWENE